MRCAAAYGSKSSKQVFGLPWRSNSRLALNIMFVGRAAFAGTDAWWRCTAANDCLRGGVARTACCSSRNFDSSLLLRQVASKSRAACQRKRTVLLPLG